MIKRAIIVVSAMSILGGCAMMGDVEAEIVKRQAIQDAQVLSKDMKLGYLTCFGYWDDYKRQKCKNIIKPHTSENRQNAINWEYIREHDYEAARLGFLAFLEGKRKACAGIDHTPEYSRKDNAYVVNCVDGNSYMMAFNNGEGIWRIQ